MSRYPCVDICRYLGLEGRGQGRQWRHDRLQLLQLGQRGEEGWPENNTEFRYLVKM